MGQDVAEGWLAGKILIFDRRRERCKCYVDRARGLSGSYRPLVLQMLLGISWLLWSLEN
jgi:hypothetical protein